MEEVMSSLKSLSLWISTYLPLANVIACLIYLIHAGLVMDTICSLIILIQGMLMFLALHFVPTRLKWKTGEVIIRISDKTLNLGSCNDRCIIITNVAALVLAVMIAAGFQGLIWGATASARLGIFLNLVYLLVFSWLPKWEKENYRSLTTT
jgi:hypothetical protein